MIQRKTFSHRTKTKYNVRVATTISIIAFIALAARFMYVFYMGDSDLKGDFSGFEWLSAFLFTFGIELSMVGMGALMWISTQFHSRKSMSKKLFRVIGVSWMSVGFFFMAWIFTSATVFTKLYEVIFAAIIAIVATVISVLLIMFISKELANVKELKNSFFDFILEFRLHYRKLLVNALHRNEEYKATYKEILDIEILDDPYDEMLKKETEKTENSMKNVVQEIDGWDK
jgi:hypothetical protein